MAAHSRNSSFVSVQTWRKLAILVLAVLLILVLITQIKSLSPSLRLVRHADTGYLALGLLATIGTFVVAAGMYTLLAFHELRYTRTLLIQTASGFSSRLLPAGLGGMGLIAQYLRKQQHTTAEAVTVVGVDNIIGIIGHFLLFGLAVIVANVSFDQIKVPHASYLAVGLLVLLAAVVVFVRRLRTAARRVIGQIAHDVAKYRKHPWRVIAAMCNSILLTLLYVSVLWASAYAVGSDLSFAKILVVFTAGSIIGNATPTPGGVIGAEAGLFAGFVAYHVGSSTALAAALVYRLLTYWLPILPGIAAFWLAQRRLKLIG